MRGPTMRWWTGMRIHMSCSAFPWSAGYASATVSVKIFPCSLGSRGCWAMANMGGKRCSRCSDMCAAFAMRLYTVHCILKQQRLREQRKKKPHRRLLLPTATNEVILLLKDEVIARRGSDRPRRAWWPMGAAIPRHAGTAAQLAGRPEFQPWQLRHAARSHIIGRSMP